MTQGRETFLVEWKIFLPEILSYMSSRHVPETTTWYTAREYSTGIPPKQDLLMGSRFPEVHSTEIYEICFTRKRTHPNFLGTFPACFNCPGTTDQKPLHIKTYILNVSYTLFTASLPLPWTQLHMSQVGGHLVFEGNTQLFDLKKDDTVLRLQSRSAALLNTRTVVPENCA